MTRSLAWTWALLAPAVVLVLTSCGTAQETDGLGDEGATGGAAGTGGAGSGGSEQGSGGEIGSSGSEQGSGGELGSGGNVSGTGGRGGLMSNQCTDAYGCAEGATCYAPGVAPPTICGAPDWCGSCSCPAMLQEPAGAGVSCDEATPCPSVTDTVQRAASVCDAEIHQCTECRTDADCGDDVPYCGVDASTGARMCFQCEVDADCSGETPICFRISAGFASNAFGSCRECKVTADCDVGVCSVEGLCLPGCQSDTQCDPNFVCGAEERCVPEPCQEDSECSEQSTCSDQTCRARACTSDAACPGGHCVGGGCYETPGVCHYDTAG